MSNHLNIKAQQILKHKSAKIFCKVLNSKDKVEMVLAKTQLILTWEIIDFELGKTYESEKFTILDKNEWLLRFLPNKGDPNYYEFALVSPSACYGHTKNIHMTLSIIDEMKMAKNIYKKTLSDFSNVDYRYVKNFVQEKHLNKNNNLLSNGKLTLKCELYIDDNEDFFTNLNNAGQQLYLKECIDFEKLLESKKFSDIKLIVGDKELHAHKCILATRSEYFSAMFDHDVKETRENSIEITDFSYEVIMEVLRFIYSGKVNNHEELSTDLLKAANKYQINQLKEFCENTLINNLSIENIGETLHIIDLYNTEKLKKYAFEFLTENGKSLINTEAFNSALKLLSTNMLIELYTSALNNLLF